MGLKAQFTLIEVLVAMAIILVLLGLLAGATLSRQGARRSQALSNLKRMEIALQVYYQDHGHYPQSPKPSPINWSASSLVTSSGKPCLEGYAPDRFVDAWGRPFRYQCPGVMNDTSFDLWSLGPDGAPGAANADDDNDGAIDEDGSTQPAQGYRSDSQHPGADASDDIANWKRH